MRGDEPDRRRARRERDELWAFEMDGVAFGSGCGNRDRRRDGLAADFQSVAGRQPAETRLTPAFGLARAGFNPGPDACEHDHVV